MPSNKSFHIESKEDFIRNVLTISDQFDYFCLLNSNAYSTNDSKFDLLVAFGNDDYVVANNFNEIDRFTSKNKWSFGYLSYDLKNDVEDLISSHEDHINANGGFFFNPTFLMKSDGKKINVLLDKQNLTNDLIDLLNSKSKKNISSDNKVNIKTKETYNDYIAAVSEIKKHIKRGDIYEANYCTEFYAKDAVISPSDLFLNLNKVSPTPFSAYIKQKEKVVISASPERFLKREKNKIISQPIKGTARRSKDRTDDEKIKSELKHSAKNISENIMIVDLVRNDLSKYAINNSVVVDELCEIYSFPHVHQMISTISANVDDNCNNIDIIKEAFPPGSMTGAPKVQAMKLMEQYEKTKRGIYSGAVGYFTPKGDFDFNVVIRTIIYNTQNKYLSFMVGGAITDKSVPEEEYEECLIKAQAMLDALGISSDQLNS